MESLLITQKHMAVVLTISERKVRFNLNHPSIAIKAI